MSSSQASKVWKAASLKADPRQQQDWFLKSLQGGRAHPLAACGVATLSGCWKPGFSLQSFGFVGGTHRPQHAAVLHAAATCNTPAIAV
jgi:hypothetical protein